MKRISKITGLFTLILIALNYIIDQTVLIKQSDLTVSDKVIEVAGDGTGTCIGRT